MATKAATGAGLQFQRGNGATPEVFTTVAELTKISGPQIKADTADASNFDSANNYKEFISGMIDPGEISLEGNFLGNLDASQLALLTDLNSRTLRNWKILGPTASPFTFTFAGIVVEYSPAYEMDKAMTLSAKIKISGATTLA